MALVTLKKGNSVVMYPETKVQQLNDKGAAGASVLQVATPGSVSFGFLDPTHGFYPQNAAYVRNEFDLVSEDHTHLIEDVTGLQAALDLKVPLDETDKIPIDKFPTVNVAPMRFKGAAAGAGTSAGATGLSTVIPGLTTMASEDDFNKYKNDYVIVTTEGFFVADSLTLTIDSVSSTVNFELARSYLEADDPQAVNSEQAVYLEVGDRIVLQSWVDNGDGTYTLKFGIINVNNNLANTSLFGVASLSNPAGLSGRADLNSAIDATKVVDEAALRASMKDIRSYCEFAGTGGAIHSVISYDSYTSNHTSDINNVLTYLNANLGSYSGVVDDQILVYFTPTKFDILKYDGSSWVNAGLSSVNDVNCDTTMTYKDTNGTDEYYPTGARIMGDAYVYANGGLNSFETDDLVFVVHNVQA